MSPTASEETAKDPSSLAESEAVDDVGSQHTDDSATEGASKDLQHASISDRDSPSHTPAQSRQEAGDQNSESKQDSPQDLKEASAQKRGRDDEPTQAASDEAEATKKQHGSDEESLASPKKKRGRVQDDDKQAEVSANGSASLEPEKKRARDEETEHTTVRVSRGVSDPQTPKTEPQTSDSAFASSGFAALASSSTSGFGSLGSQPSVFGAKPALSFGSVGDSKPLGAGFGAVRGFGSFGGGFGGSAKLSTFAAPGKSDILSEKPAKAFGAPESDEDEDEEDDQDSEEESEEVTQDKKVKLGKGPVEDGEAGEATLLQVRAKLFVLDKTDGWKERGVGAVKINVPESCVELDDNGHVIAGSYSESEGVVRLIMRQDSTHRVILNTVIVKGMQFQEKPSGNGVRVIFTAFEDTAPVNMLLKMNETSAKQFMSEIKSIHG